MTTSMTQSIGRTKQSVHPQIGQALCFAASSLLGFCIDYICYSLFVFLLAPFGAAAIPISNIAARILSATTNFLFNRHYVFCSHASAAQTGAAYAALAVSILAGNTLLLGTLVNGCGWNKYGAKLLTEITFFSLSWLAQKHLIFHKNTNI